MLTCSYPVDKFKYPKKNTMKTQRYIISLFAINLGNCHLIEVISFYDYSYFKKHRLSKSFCNIPILIGFANHDIDYC